ncbi:winged helix-turn-helix domain-containing protein [Streptomyces sp. NPDC048420]|uniref:winged helix-turn-helix domain-containing protein n=1 Tax=Streptomyces sp. NPDC048420 TaxID=3155755 RepID=UPI00343DF977
MPAGARPASATRPRATSRRARTRAKGGLAGRPGRPLSPGSRSERSAEPWRRAWREGGMDALASTGPAQLPKLSDGRFVELEKELALGPATYAWEDQTRPDQRWAVARIGELIARTFGVECSSAAVWRLMRRDGWSWQCSARRAVERDGGAVGLWRRTCGRRWNGCGGAGGIHRLRGEAGFSMTRHAHAPGPAWAHAGGGGAGPVLAPLVDRCDVP